VTGLKKNGELFYKQENILPKTNQNPLKLIMKLLPTPSIGELPEQFKQLRTKEVVVRAGLSHQLQPWKVLTKFSLVHCYPSQNNNSLTVLELKEIMAAVEGSQQTPSLTTRLIMRCQNLLIPTLAEMEHASTLLQAPVLNQLVL
jgi:hypothetical protein